MRLVQLRDVLIGGLIQAGKVFCEEFTLQDDDDIMDFLCTAGKGIRRFEGRRRKRYWPHGDDDLLYRAAGRPQPELHLHAVQGEAL